MKFILMQLFYKPIKIIKYLTLILHYEFCSVSTAQADAEIFCFARGTLNYFGLEICCATARPAKVSDRVVHSCKKVAQLRGMRLKTRGNYAVHKFKMSAVMAVTGHRFSSKATICNVTPNQPIGIHFSAYNKSLIQLYGRR